MWPRKFDAPLSGAHNFHISIFSEKNMKNGLIIHLGGRFTVTQGNFDFYRELVETVIPDMEMGKSFTLKKLFGEEFWEYFDDWERRLIGKCVAFMVTRNLLPLRFTGSIKTNPKHYQRF